MQAPHSTSSTPAARKAAVVLIQICAFITAGLVILIAGIAIGNGNIAFGSRGDAPSNVPEDMDYASVEQVYDLIRKNYDGKLDTNQLLDGMKKGMAEATGDQWTSYMSPKEAKEFEDEINGTFTGIGATLHQEKDGAIGVIAPITGSPAEKAGLRSKDIIIAINDTSTTGLSIDEAISKIRGEAGTKVTLKIVRNQKENLTFTITRDVIQVPSVEWKILDDNIGYMRISEFSKGAPKLATQAAQEFKQKNVKSVVLDLRSNPGGTLPGAIDIASLWLSSDKVVLKEQKGGIVTNTYYATGNDILKGIPTRVLIDGGSASASEIVAGALRDNNAATLYGEKSFGKGRVQDVKDLPNGGIIKITIAHWLRPNGQDIDKKGITPDKVITMTEEDYAADRDPQKDAAISSLKGQ